MQAHIVSCYECGKRFDTNNGAYYIKEKRRYMCPNCGMRMEGQPGIIRHDPVVEEVKLDTVEKRAKADGIKKPTTGGTIAKIAIGLIFIAVPYTKTETGKAQELSVIVMGLIIGLALIAWALIPYLKYRSWLKKDEQRREDERLARILAQPLKTIGNSEIDELASKYDKLEKPEEKVPMH